MNEILGRSQSQEWFVMAKKLWILCIEFFAMVQWNSSDQVKPNTYTIAHKISSKQHCHHQLVRVIPRTNIPKELITHDCPGVIFLAVWMNIFDDNYSWRKWEVDREIKGFNNSTLRGLQLWAQFLKDKIKKMVYDTTTRGGGKLYLHSGLLAGQRFTFCAWQGILGVR